VSKRPERDLATATTLLCDADGTLFPSEEPAFEASAGVVNDLMAELGVEVSFSGDQLRRMASGRNFRALVTDLARESGRAIPAESLESWVQSEMEVVTDHLRTILRPDEGVLGALEGLCRRLDLALVSSSALRRLEACLDATGTSALFPETARFSAQDSLPTPTSKPDPAVYLHAVEVLGLQPGEAVAVEDAAAGVASARDAGLPVLGLVQFVPPDERAARAEELRGAGAVEVVRSWDDLVDLLDPRRVAPLGVETR
jgi:beta-phosphoglucomutase-like phosphatase (HAD superfamily)